MADKLYEEKLEQIKFLEDNGINPYPCEPPKRTHKNNLVVSSFDELNGEEVDVVGRITGKRGHGKLIFLDLEDESGKVQVMIKADKVGENQIDIFKKGFGIGDFVGINGTVFKTIAGEVSIDTNSFVMLAKSLLPVPPKRTREKDAISDPELRARQRYLDMIAHPEVIERFKTRSKMVQFMRNRFLELGCIEMETPILDWIYGGANARPFNTHHNALDLDLFLRISNELYLKKLLIGGMEGVFEFSRDFRNEGIDKTHNPEFTQVEVYKAYTDYIYMMEMMENLIADMAKELLGKTKINYQGMEIELAAPWKRLSIYDGLKETMKFDVEKISKEELLAIAKKEGIEETDEGHILCELFDKYVQPTLINPTFVIDWPESTSPLAKIHRSKKGLVERFECHVGKTEIANCYTELNDSRKQRANFEAEMKRNTEGDKEAMPNDEDFIVAMEYGMPPAGGIGIAIDRWAMIFTDAEHIRDVLTFPLMKPLK